MAVKHVAKGRGGRERPQPSCWSGLPHPRGRTVDASQQDGRATWEAVWNMNSTKLSVFRWILGIFHNEEAFPKMGCVRFLSEKSPVTCKCGRTWEPSVRPVPATLGEVPARLPSSGWHRDQPLLGGGDQSLDPLPLRIWGFVAQLRSGSPSGDPQWRAEAPREAHGASLPLGRAAPKCWLCVPSSRGRGHRAGGFSTRQVPGWSPGPLVCPGGSPGPCPFAPAAVGPGPVS